MFMSSKSSKVSEVPGTVGGARVAAGAGASPPKRSNSADSCDEGYRGREGGRE